MNRGPSEKWLFQEPLNASGDISSPDEQLRLNLSSFLFFLNGSCYEEIWKEQTDPIERQIQRELAAAILHEPEFPELVRKESCVWILLRTLKKDPSGHLLGLFEMWREFLLRGIQIRRCICGCGLFTLAKGVKRTIYPGHYREYNKRSLVRLKEEWIREFPSLAEHGKYVDRKTRMRIKRNMER